MPDPALLKPDSIRLLPLAAPLALTQIIGWGSTFWLPPMLAGVPGARARHADGGDLRRRDGDAAGGRGRWRRASDAPVDAHGARWPMVAGSLFLALALLAIAHARGHEVTYLLGWTLVGLGMPLVLTQAPAAAIAQMAGPKRAAGDRSAHAARRAVVQRVLAARHGAGAGASAGAACVSSSRR
jgi:hypothetical protein